jgi:DNA-binding NtrC family response regulator
VAATNRDLEQRVREGRFREDLYHRLNVIAIRLPPLREIPADVPALVAHFVGRFARETKKAITGVAAEAEARLLAYRWPAGC